MLQANVYIVDVGNKAKRCSKMYYLCKAPWASDHGSYGTSKGFYGDHIRVGSGIEHMLYWQLGTETTCRFAVDEAPNILSAL